ncbi:MAG: hypothetical protein IT355_00965 [Gemmatimonadaceae bacterium]|nr:hypothetical protein [Gemmatimonadaceae bacterium]
MTIPPVHAAGGGMPPVRLPLLTAPVLTGIPPTVGDPALLPHREPRSLPPDGSGGPQRADPPISLAGRLDEGGQLPDTTSLAVALESATRALQTGRADLVLAALDAIWSPQLGTDSPWYLRAAALQLLGRTSDAEQVLRDAVARLPRSAAVLYLLGLHTADRGEFEAARIASEHALALHPAEPLLLLQRAALAERSGDMALASSLLQQVAAHDPGCPAAQWLHTLTGIGGGASLPGTGAAPGMRRTPVLPATVAPDGADMLPPAFTALEGALRLGLSLLASPLQSARSATRVSGSLEAVTARAGQYAAPVSPPLAPIALPSWHGMAIACSLLVMAGVPPLRLPAVIVCGVSVLLSVARRTR